jgi:ParB-like chromosome segregation protein Spo0J
MVTYKTMTIPLEELLLDPNNFRFKRPDSDSDVAESRFIEGSVQAAMLERIKSDGIQELKRSIAENGFVPVERIVVRAFEGSEEASQKDGGQKYVVIEGNRRTAALKYLKSEHAGGVAVAASIAHVFSAVPVLLAEDATDDDLLAIMGIRHVGGPKEWGGYQSALLVYQLLDGTGLSAREVASRLGLSVQEVNRRHRAFSVLTQMKDDEEYGESVSPELYPIFHEAIGQPTIREWLGWDVTEGKFLKDGNRELLYGWLSATDDKTRKISSYGEMRELKQILENPDALTALKDDDQSFADALAIVKSEAKATRWFPNAKAALASLKEMGAETITNLDESGLTVLSELKSSAAFILLANKVQAAADADDED